MSVSGLSGLRGFLPPEDYPSRETALAIVEALRKAEAGTSSELERLTGIPNVLTVADRCYMVYGYPELEPAAVARGMTEVFMRPTGSAPREGVAGGSGGLSRPATPATPSARPEGAKIVVADNKVMGSQAALHGPYKSDPEAATYGFTLRR
ncbi:hypothetical protein [Mesorhizobium sp. B2-4-6]|uniref:hypothetical protein n=1 Tax=Mesorhizobium sp. B2-4-6 TaxID=2589943 RepID=UPI00112D7A33|nr:hypothetical protein [Mesorhizobium sp. B2-4-6]TPL45441.1 hypothetical protein FJ957_21300 [Mesorhizobium sp. B2-4-6]